MFYIGLILLVLHIAGISGHGYLADPIARSSAWLFDQDFAKCCTYYDHLQMSCGGMHRQWAANGGKCSVCGEAADLKTQVLGVGGSMYLGKIVRTYNQGATIPVTVVLTANHMGSFEFRVCSIDNDPSQDATQSCLDLNILKLGNGLTQLPVNSMDTTVYLNVTLPANLTCEHCVFQWKYKTGNSWGVSNMGRGCLGCGRENEEFYGCSDIAIVNSSATTNRPTVTNPSVTNSSAVTSPSTTNNPTIVTSPSSTSSSTIAQQNVESVPVYRNCASKLTFSQQHDLSGIMQYYCQNICLHRCAMDRVQGREVRYDGCVKSCDVLCTCQ